MKNKDDLLLSIIQSPVNQSSNNAVVEKKDKDKKKKDSFQEDPFSVEYTFGDSVENEDKYKQKIKKQAEEDPTSVVIDTSRGEMTLAEAMREGYNPETDEFKKELMPPNPETMGIDPALMAKLEQLMQMPQGGRRLPPGAPPSEEEIMMQQMMGEQSMSEEQTIPTEGENIDEELLALEQGGIM
jgi:hypothetical protein